MGAHKTLDYLLGKVRSFAGGVAITLSCLGTVYAISAARTDPFEQAIQKVFGAEQLYEFENEAAKREFTKMARRATYGMDLSEKQYQKAIISLAGNCDNEMYFSPGVITRREVNDFSYFKAAPSETIERALKRTG